MRVAVEDVTDFTSAPNAYAVGFGPSKRIVFWNTLLDGRFSDGEVKVVLAHELGHHSRNHIPESIGWYALFALRGLADRGRDPPARRHGEPGGGAALAARDRRARPRLAARLQRDLAAHGAGGGLGRARDDPRPRLGAGLFRNFTIESLNDPDPPAWSYLLFDSHPSVEQRIAMAEAWRGPV